MDNAIGVENASVDVACENEKTIEQESITVNEKVGFISNQYETVENEVQEQSLCENASINETPIISSETDSSIKDELSQVLQTEVINSQTMDDSLTLNISADTASLIPEEGLSGNIVDPSNIEEPSTLTQPPSNSAEPSDIASSVAEESPTVTEEASSVADEPSTITEEPATVTEDLPSVTEESSAVKEELSDVTEESSGIVEEPFTVTEETSNVLNEPSAVGEESTVVIEEISNVVNEPSSEAASAAESANIVEEPSNIVIEEPSEEESPPAEQSEVTCVEVNSAEDEVASALVEAESNTVIEMQQNSEGEQVIHQEMPEQQEEVSEMTIVQEEGEYIIPDHEHEDSNNYTEMVEEVLEVQNSSDIPSIGGEETLAVNESDESIVIEQSDQQHLITLDTSAEEGQEVIYITEKEFQSRVAANDPELTQVLIVEGENTIIFEPVYYGDNEGQIIINESTGEMEKVINMEATQERVQQHRNTMDDVEMRIMNLEGVEETEVVEKSAESAPTPPPPRRVVEVPKPIVKKPKLLKHSIDPSPDVKIPGHMLGRNVEKPCEDIMMNGRVPPKPRLGVKVPYRNLTSQIVSKQELAEEIMERSKHRNLIQDQPEGGDIFFAKKLTQRLANKLAPLKKLSSLVEAEKGGDAAASGSGASSSKGPDGQQKDAQVDAAQENADLIALLEADSAEELELLEKKPVIVSASPMESRRTAAKKTVFAGAKLLPDEQKEKLKQAKIAAKKAEEEAEAKKREYERQVALKQLSELPSLPTVCKGSGLAARRKRLEEERLKKIAKLGKLLKTEPGDSPTPSMNENSEPVLKVSNITKTYSRKRRGEEEDLDMQGSKAVDENNVPAEETTTQPVGKITRTGKKGVAKAAVKVEVAPPVVTAPLLSKRSRIIKKKVIWDPDAPPTPTLQQEVKRTVAAIKQELEALPPKQQQRVLPKRGVIPQRAAGGLAAATPTTTLRKKTNSKVVKQYLQTKKQLLMKRKQQMREMHQRRQREARNEDVATPPPSETASNKASPASSGKERKQHKTEIEKLLMDEGAVNMIYSIKHTGENSDAGSPKKRKAISLTNKTLEIKNNLSAVVDTGPSAGKALRKKEISQTKLTPAIIRKKGQESVRSSVHSPPPSPGFQFRATAECSRIIRRHSSSSSFSSDNEGEGRTKEHKESKNNDPVVIQRSVAAHNGDKNDSPATGRPLRKKGVPIYVSTGNKKTYKGKRKLDSVVEASTPEDQVFSSTNNNASPAPPEVDIKPPAKLLKLNPKTKPKLLTNADLTKVSTEMAKNFKRCSLRNKPQANADGADLIVIEDNGAMEDLPNALQYANYKEISLKKLEQLVQIVLTPAHNSGASPNQTNTFSIQMFKELCDALDKLQTDDDVRAVLVTSAGSTFCHGVDWTSLVVPEKAGRRDMATTTAKAMKEFLMALAHFPKPLIVGIQGAAENLGVTMLPLFDMVLASDKATFRTPYAKVGSAPEAGVLLTMGHLQQNTLVSELLLTCKKITASEALRCGLVTRILWPDKFHEELIPIAKGIASQSAQSMQATKALLRLPLWEKLEEALQREQAVLIKHWTSEEFQKNVQFYNEDDD